MRGPVPGGRGAPRAGGAGERRDIGGEARAKGPEGTEGSAGPSAARAGRGGEAAKAEQAEAGRGGKQSREAPGWHVGVGATGGGSNASGSVAIS